MITQEIQHVDLLRVGEGYIAIKINQLRYHDFISFFFGHHPVPVWQVVPVTQIMVLFDVRQLMKEHLKPLKLRQALFNND